MHEIFFNSFDCIVLKEISEFAAGQPVLEWEKHVKIAAAAARGICSRSYMHTYFSPEL